MVRAKFMVTSTKRNYYRGAEGKVLDFGTVEIHLTPQYDNSIEEDRRFAEATPSGEIILHVNNPPAINYLQPGEEFYVDFTKVADVK